MSLLERDEHLRAAAGYLADAAAGHGRLVYVGGEAGVGKTSFVEEVSARADARVAVGWCDGSATPPPLRVEFTWTTRLPRTCAAMRRKRSTSACPTMGT